MEDFKRKNHGAAELLTEEKEGLFWGSGVFVLGEEEEKSFHRADCLLFVGGGEDSCDR